MHRSTISAGILLAALAVSAPLEAQALSRDCRRERPSARDASHGALVDSIRGVLRQAAHGAAAAEVPPLAGLVAVDEPERGVFRVRMHGADLPPAVADAMRSAAQAQRARWPRFRSFRVLVRFDPAADTAAQAPSAAAPVNCLPVLANHGLVARTLRQWVARHVEKVPPPVPATDRAELPAGMARGREDTASYRAEVGAVVTRDGEVVFIDVQQRSGWDTYDAALNELAATMRFDVATVDGKPQDMWIVIPLTVVIPEGRQPIRPPS